MNDSDSTQLLFQQYLEWAKSHPGQPVEQFGAQFGIDAAGLEKLIRRAVIARKSELSRIDAEEKWPKTNPILPESLRPDSQIDSYRLLSILGEGGMGVVWLAEQRKPVYRRVALKLIKHQMESAGVIARFEAERQALALMNHPHIARVLDAGTAADGRPYFVMELVSGKPITEYCDDETLTIKQRLELVQLVCQAVNHAHQKGILHRDLKPSNVLVTELDGKPHPIVIDFGIAKALDNAGKLTDRTLYSQPGQLMGTLQYMSPEQASETSFDVDTRTDVYSLGIVMYELLAGSTPLVSSDFHGLAILQAAARVRDSNPPRPSSKIANADNEMAIRIARTRRINVDRLKNELSGELDWIVLKSIEKERSLRYASPADLASDIENYIDGNAVQAGPKTFGYRMRKGIRRNRALVLSITSVFVVIIVIGILSTWLAYAKSQLASQRNRSLSEVQELLTRESKLNQDLAIESKQKGELLRSKSELLRNASDRSMVQAALAWQRSEFGDAIAHACNAIRQDSSNLSAKQWLYFLLGDPDLSERVPVSNFIGGDEETKQAVLSRMGDVAATVDTDDRVQIWDLATLQPVDEPFFIDGDLKDVRSVGETVRLLVSKPNETIIKTLSVNNGIVEELVSYSGLGNVWNMRLSKSGDWVLVEQVGVVEGTMNVLDSRFARIKSFETSLGLKLNLDETSLTYVERGANRTVVRRFSFEDWNEEVIDEAANSNDSLEYDATHAMLKGVPLEGAEWNERLGEWSNRLRIWANENYFDVEQNWDALAIDRSGSRVVVQSRERIRLLAFRKGSKGAANEAVLEQPPWSRLRPDFPVACFSSSQLLHATVSPNCIASWSLEGLDRELNPRNTDLGRSSTIALERMVVEYQGSSKRSALDIYHIPINVSLLGTILLGDSSGIKVACIPTIPQAFVILLPDFSQTRAVVSPDESTLSFYQDYGSFLVVDLTSGGTLIQPTNGLFLGFGQGKEFFARIDGNQIRRFDLERRDSMLVCRMEQSIERPVFSDDRRYVAWTSGSGTDRPMFHLHDIASNRTESLPNKGDFFSPVRFLPDSSRLLGQLSSPARTRSYSLSIGRNVAVSLDQLFKEGQFATTTECEPILGTYATQFPVGPRFMQNGDEEIYDIETAKSAYCPWLLRSRTGVGGRVDFEGLKGSPTIFQRHEFRDNEIHTSFWDVSTATPLAKTIKYTGNQRRPIILEVQSDELVFVAPGGKPSRFRQGMLPQLLSEFPTDSEVLEWAESVGGKRISETGRLEELSLAYRKQLLENPFQLDGVWGDLQQWLEAPSVDRPPGPTWQAINNY